MSTYSQLDASGSDQLARVYPEKIFLNTVVKDRCATKDGTRPFYVDDNHVNSIGAAMIAADAVRAIEEKGWAGATARGFGGK
jgi:hypothetical protein